MVMVRALCLFLLVLASCFSAKGNQLSCYKDDEGWNEENGGIEVVPHWLGSGMTGWFSSSYMTTQPEEFFSTGPDRTMSLSRMNAET